VKNYEGSLIWLNKICLKVRFGLCFDKKMNKSIQQYRYDIFESITSGSKLAIK
jgi:hypothetical protein